MENKYLYSGVLVGIFGFLILTFSKPVYAQTSAYPIHNFTLDTLGKTLLLNDSVSDRFGDLKETLSGVTIQDWSVKYAQKGSSRQMCRPPVLNVSFISGTPKNLFRGATTYGVNPTLKYKKVRLIPECDIWNDYWLSDGDIGFSGQLNVSLREYIIFKIFRTLGVPTMDIVGFANVNFITPDPGYTGQSFRYMMVQRDDETKDEIPFTTQFSLNPILYESSDIEGGNVSWTYRQINRLTSAEIVNKSDGSVIKQLSFDPDTTIRFLLLTNFLNLSDMAPLHNEDWGINNTTGKTEIIPHGFDLSFSCSLGNSLANIDVFQFINQLPSGMSSSYKLAYYNIARNIFGNSASLDQMIDLVNQFPYGDVDKSLLIEFLKIRFYQYADYFDSAGFAASMGQDYQSLHIALPFASDQEYQTHLASFYNKCRPIPITLEGASVSVVGQGKLERDVNNPTYATAVFTVNVKTGNVAMQVLKSTAFAFTLVGTGSNDNPNNINVWYSAPTSGVIDNPGPYYLISPNSTAQFKIYGSISSDSLLKDTYYITLKGFQPNSRVNSFTLDAKTNTLAFGSLEPIVVTAPQSGDNLVFGSPYNIKWSGNPRQFTSIVINSENGNQYYITNPDAPSVQGSSEYLWTVGKAYVYKKDGQYMLSDIPSGRYKIWVRDNNVAGINGDSGYFTIVPSADYSPSTVFITSLSALKLVYDPSGGESSLVSTSSVVVKAGSQDQKISKSGAFWSYATDGKNNTQGAVQYHSSPDTKDDGNGYYVIPANTAATFTIITTFNPKIMFAGAYHGVLGQVTLGDFANPTRITIPAPNTTDAVVIIGEVSPYIDSISPNPVASNQTATISGVRFDTTNNLIKLTNASPGLTKSLTAVPSTNGGTNISFIPGVDAGTYILSVTHPKTGASNNVQLIVTPPTDQTISVSASLVSANEDRAGVWNVFKKGNQGKLPYDWHIFASIKTAGKSIRSLKLNQSNGETWSTNNSSNYPLVVFQSGNQVNTSYINDLNLIGSEKQSNLITLDLYAQISSQAWIGGTLAVIFNDGSTDIRAQIPASTIVPPTSLTPGTESQTSQSVQIITPPTPPAPPAPNPAANTQITPPATPPTPALIQSPASLSITASFLNTFDDHAGTWGIFGPGREGSFAPDWNWSLSVTASNTTASIASITVVHNNGETWSTSNPSNYPLVVFNTNGSQLNSSYGTQIPLNQGSGSFKLYGQMASQSFSGGTVTVKLTDGTEAKATLPAYAYSAAQSNTSAQASSVFDALIRYVNLWNVAW